MTQYFNATNVTLGEITYNKEKSNVKSNIEKQTKQRSN